MMEHREIQNLLYDFVAGTLSAHERDMVGEHCATCAECRATASAIRDVLDLLPASSPPPSESRSEEFWSTFAGKLDERIRKESTVRPGIWRQLEENLEQLLTEYWKPATAAAGILATGLLAVIFLSPSPTADSPRELAANVAPSAPDSTSEQLAKYLRKSRTLLVGIQNMEVASGTTPDLVTERRISRELASEARRLQNRPLDPQSEHLVRDLEKLFISLSAAEGQTERPVLDLLRTGLERENILFKIRMAETAYGSGTLVRTASARRE